MTKKTKPESYAFSQNFPISADKARRVIDRIRGRSYEETLIILELLPYRAAYPILKFVCFAASNASSTSTSKKENLFISKAEVNERPAIKKLKPRARGRSFPIKKATCHITIVLTDLSFYFNELVEPQQEKNLLTKLYLNLRGLWDKK
uniref:Large ribosomal subunit protein uL22c n=1 Tax=Cuscuta obtusiflora TaxID=437280 RepID=RK22_CUSOB|nr:ribosomal protein L22 [Cuscuta obtusiflora]A8W3M1.1 RecName: Full=Large ribosomal subunit protein uL22c; AltName: Full=50S ribosomal protein L22, plastid [Cuscuta obtusiflora]ABW20596.1 ribosomal protein L22 [Cuscuta obtusiflora]